MFDYKLEIILSFLKILLPLIPISFVSIFFIKILKFADFIERVLLLFLFNWVQIIVSIEILSLFKSVSLIPLIIFYTILAIVCLIITLKKKINFKFNFSELKPITVNFFNKLEINKVLKIIIIVWLLVIISIILFFGLYASPSNYDSMTYHLARVGFWKQNQSINHYFTWAEIQNQNPINAEVGLLWIIIFTNSDNIAFIVQWLSFVIILLALYKLLRLLNYSRGISLITVFVFSTLDIVILEAYSTQNDLVIACFIIITLFLLVKVSQSEKIDLKYIIAAGFSVGLAIGTKGYSYLFIPGFLLFFIIYGKNNKVKFLKLLYVILFSIAGVFFLASYNFLQNFLSYGNIFSSTQFIESTSIKNPNFSTFVSNFIRHIDSFYQLYELDFGTVGTLIKKITYFIHNKIGLDISSRVTTWPGVYFYFSNLRTNFDESYFGPVYFFFILPSIFYNFLLFIFLRLWKRGLDLVNRYKNSLIISIIPICFFIGYTFIFKWEPYTGRLMVAFALLTMICFAELIDLLKATRLKYFYVIVIYMLIIMSMASSCLPLFKGDYISPKSIDLNISYEDRRSWSIDEVKDVIDLTLPKNYKLGLILYTGDWVYILFDNDFNNSLMYISEEEWNNKDIKEILSDNNLDGLLINTNAEPFINKILKPVKEKMIGKSIIRIDKSNFNKYFKPLSACEFAASKEGVLIKVYGNDPYFETIFPVDFAEEKPAVMIITLKSNADACGQIFYGRTGSYYNEDDSERFEINEGINKIYIVIPDTKDIEKIRIDPINIDEDCMIEKIEINEYEGIDYESKKVNEYILFY